jgi:hypothetical protein
MTYLHWKRQGKSLDWADKIGTKGMMWASPGPYLKQSMLRSFARKVSEFYLPEAFWKDTTFDSAPDAPERSAEEEETLALALSVRSKNAGTGNAEDDEDDDDEAWEWSA